MKKLMAAVMTAMIGTAVLADTEAYDVFDVKISATTPYIKNGIRDYRSDTWTGKLTVTYTDEGAVDEATCTMTQKRLGITEDFEVTIDCASVVGKTFKKPTVYLTLKSDTVTFNLAGTGSFKTIRKAGCTPCGQPTTECKKPSFSGKVVGMYDCECGAGSPTRVLVECGASEETMSLAALQGTFSIKWNKKESVLD